MLCGLDVFATDAGTVVIRAGAAVDGGGREIVVPHDVEIDPALLTDACGQTDGEADRRGRRDHLALLSRVRHRAGRDPRGVVRRRAPLRAGDDPRELLGLGDRGHAARGRRRALRGPLGERRARSRWFGRHGWAVRACRPAGRLRPGGAPHMRLRLRRPVRAAGDRRRRGAEAAAGRSARPHRHPIEPRAAGADPVPGRAPRGVLRASRAGSGAADRRHVPLARLPIRPPSSQNSRAPGRSRSRSTSR